MKLLLKLCALAVLAGSVTAASAQGYKTNTVPNAPAFSAVEVRGNDVDVYFTQGEGYAFSVSGAEKLLKKLSVKIKDSTLFIKYNGPLWGDDNDVKVSVTAPQLTAVSVFGDGEFECKTPYRGQALKISTGQDGEVSFKNAVISQLTIEAKGTSSVDFDYIEADNIRIVTQNRPEVELAGTTGQLEVVNQGKAEIDTAKLTVTQPVATAGNQAVGKVAQDGSVEFSF